MAKGKKEKAKGTKGNGSAGFTPEQMAELGFEAEAGPVLGGSRFNTISLTPTGFILKSEAGEKPVQTVEGIIFHEEPSKVYYSSKDVLNQPPDCYSRDGITGSVYGACAQCKFSYKALMRGAPKGRKMPDVPYCKDKHSLFLKLEPTGPFWLLRLATMSLPRWQVYVQQLKGQAIHFASRWTHFSVTTRKNAGGVPYGEVNFLVGKPVAAALLKDIGAEARSLRESYTPQLPERAEGASPDSFV